MQDALTGKNEKLKAGRPGPPGVPLGPALGALEDGENCSSLQLEDCPFSPPGRTTQRGGEFLQGGLCSPTSPNFFHK